MKATNQFKSCTGCERTLRETLTYLGHLTPGQVGGLSHGIASYQRFMGFRDDGVWTNLEDQTLLNRFCNCPDIEHAQTGLRHWETNELRLWHDIEAFRANTEHGDLFLEGASLWSSICNLKYRLVDTKAESDIFAHWRRIDVAGRVLAWSQLPGVHQRVGSVRLEQRYDSADAFSYAQVQRALKIVGHEIGHAIGFGHSSNRLDMMFPSIINDSLEFGPGDKSGGVERYGEPGGNEPPPPPPPPPELLDIGIILGGKSYAGTVRRTK